MIELEDHVTEILRNIVQWIDDVSKPETTAQEWKAEMAWLSQDILEVISGEVSETNSLTKGL